MTTYSAHRAQAWPAERGKLVRLFGVADPDGKTPIDARLTFLSHKEEARSSFERILAWQPEKVITAHGRWYDRESTAELHRALRRLGYDSRT